MANNHGGHGPQHSTDSHGGQGASHHHILPDGLAVAIGVSLLILTGITVGFAYIDFGRFNFVIAMFVACVKASLVCLFFMNLLYDRRENGVIFATSFLFLAIFIVFTSIDLFFRGNVYVDKKALAAAAPVGGPAKFKKPWISTPELVAHGREIFAVQCASCHGAEGAGNGPAAAALNPPPRNFTQTTGWKNGRKPVLAFKTLTEGLGGMPSFASMPADDRWGVAQYVMTFNPEKPAADTPEDFAKAKVDPNATDGGGGSTQKTIPVEFAIERLATPQT